MMKQKPHLVRFGDRLFRLRMDYGISLAELGKRIGLSGNYLSEIERGQKEPSDQTIRSLAGFYGDAVEEDELFYMIGRVPLRIQEELAHSPHLKRILSEIGSNKSLTNERKEELYRKMMLLYNEFINEED